MTGGLVMLGRRLSASGLAALFVGAFLVAPAVVSAQEPGGGQRDRDAHAEALYVAGKAAYAEGRYEDAIASFEEAFELTSRPLLLYNLSLAYERTGNFHKALENLRGYVAAAPPAEQEVVRKRIQNLKRRAAAKRLEQEQAPAATVAPKPPSEPTTPPHESIVPPPVATEQVASSRALSFSAPAIATLATGGVFLIGAAVLGGLALGGRGEVAAQCTETPSGRLCRSAAREPMRRDQNLSLAADIGLGAGVAALGVGVFLLLWPPREEGVVGTSLSAAPVVGGAVVSVTGSL